MKKKEEELSVEKAKVAPPKPTFSPALLKSGMMAIKRYADIKWCPKHGINLKFCSCPKKEAKAEAKEKEAAAPVAAP